MTTLNMGIRYPTFDRGTGQDQTPNPTALSELKSNRDGLEYLYIVFPSEDIKSLFVGSPPIWTKMTFY